MLHYNNENSKASFPIGGAPVVSSFTTFGWLISVGLSELCDPLCKYKPVPSALSPLSLVMAGRRAFLLPKQPCSSPRAFALFWAKARDCCPLSPAQAVLSGAWPHVLPSDAILEPSITAGFTHFSLSVVSLVLRGLVSPKGSRCSPFPLELEGKDR